MYERNKTDEIIYQSYSEIVSVNTYIKAYNKLFSRDTDFVFIDVKRILFIISASISSLNIDY